jgi:hypothetical protein
MESSPVMRALRPVASMSRQAKTGPSGSSLSVKA